MKREVVSHKVNGLNEALKIEVLDESGPGGAHHLYTINVKENCLAPTETKAAVSHNPVYTVLAFQKGGIQEVGGVNGISNEALLAIVEDRLKCFQAGHFACRENARALTHLQESMMWLQKRTLDRMRRGVEGVSVA